MTRIYVLGLLFVLVGCEPHDTACDPRGAELATQIFNDARAIAQARCEAGGPCEPPVEVDACAPVDALQCYADTQRDMDCLGLDEVGDAGCLEARAAALEDCGAL